MNFIEISAKDGSPYIKFDPENGSLLIKGRSYDDEVMVIYNLIRNKVKEYANNGKKTLNANIFLKYFNTASSKCLFDLMGDMKKIQEQYPDFKLNLEWNYLEGDDNMKEELEDLRTAIGFEFNILEREDDII